MLLPAAQGGAHICSSPTGAHTCCYRPLRGGARCCLQRCLPRSLPYLWSSSLLNLCLHRPWTRQSPLHTVVFAFLSPHISMSLLPLSGGARSAMHPTGVHANMFEGKPLRGCRRTDPLAPKATRNPRHKWNGRNGRGASSTAPLDAASTLRIEHRHRLPGRRLLRLLFIWLFIRLLRS